MCAAASVGNADGAQALLALRANPMQPNRAGETPLQLANRAVPVNAQLVATLRGVSLNGEVAAKIEERKGALEVADLLPLLSANADINCTFGEKSAPLLHVAVRYGVSAGVLEELVVKLKADVERQDASGLAALDVAMHTGQVAVVQLLLELGASIQRPRGGRGFLLKEAQREHRPPPQLASADPIHCHCGAWWRWR